MCLCVGARSPSGGGRTRVLPNSQQEIRPERSCFLLAPSLVLEEKILLLLSTIPDVLGREPILQLIIRFAVVAGWRAEAACSKIAQGGGVGG